MSDTRIDPAKFASLSRAKYTTLLYKDLTRLGKKPNIKHDYLYIRRYKFGGQKSDLLLFIDVNDKAWQQVPLINCINGGEPEDIDIKTFASRASFGKCKVTAIGDLDGDGDDDVLITILLAKGSGPAKTKVIQFLDEGLFEGGDVLVRPLKEYKSILVKNGIKYEDGDEHGSDAKFDEKTEEGSVDDAGGELKTAEAFNEALNAIEDNLSGKPGGEVKEWAKALFLKNQAKPQLESKLIENLENAVDIGTDAPLTTEADKLKLAACKHLLLRILDEAFPKALNAIEDNLAEKPGGEVKEWAKSLFLRNKANPQKKTLIQLIDNLEKVVDVGTAASLTTEADKLKLAECKHLLLRLSNSLEELEDEEELGNDPAEGSGKEAVITAMNGIKVLVGEIKKVDKTDHANRKKALEAVILKIKAFEKLKASATAKQVQVIDDLKDRLKVELSALNTRVAEEYLEKFNIYKQSTVDGPLEKRIRLFDELNQEATEKKVSTLPGIKEALTTEQTTLKEETEQLFNELDLLKTLYGEEDERYLKLLPKFLNSGLAKTTSLLLIIFNLFVMPLTSLFKSRQKKHGTIKLTAENPVAAELEAMYGKNYTKVKEVFKGVPLEDLEIDLELVQELVNQAEDKGYYTILPFMTGTMIPEIERKIGKRKSESWRIEDKTLAGKVQSVINSDDSLFFKAVELEKLGLGTLRTNKTKAKEEINKIIDAYEMEAAKDITGLLGLLGDFNAASYNDLLHYNSILERMLAKYKNPSGSDLGPLRETSKAKKVVKEFSTKSTQLGEAIEKKTTAVENGLKQAVYEINYHLGEEGDQVLSETVLNNFILYFNESKNIKSINQNEYKNQLLDVYKKVLPPIIEKLKAIPKPDISTDEAAAEAYTIEALRKIVGVLGEVAKSITPIQANIAILEEELEIPQETGQLITEYESQIEKVREIYDAFSKVWKKKKEASDKQLEAGLSMAALAKAEKKRYEEAVSVMDPSKVNEIMEKNNQDFQALREAISKYSLKDGLNLETLKTIGTKIFNTVGKAMGINDIVKAGLDLKKAWDMKANLLKLVEINEQLSETDKSWYSYINGKKRRDFITRIFRALLKGLMGVCKLVEILSAGMAAAVTSMIKLVGKILGAVKDAYDAGKNVYKRIKGTLHKNRNRCASWLVSEFLDNEDLEKGEVVYGVVITGGADFAKLTASIPLEQGQVLLSKYDLADYTDPRSMAEATLQDIGEKAKNKKDEVLASIKGVFQSKDETERKKGGQIISALEKYKLNPFPAYRKKLETAVFNGLKSNEKGSGVSDAVDTGWSLFKQKFMS